MNGGSGTRLNVSGNYTQASTGSLTLELTAGQTITTLNVTGQASLDGAFYLNSTDGVLVQPSTGFQAISAGSLAGYFTSVSLPAANGVWHVVYQPQDFFLGVATS